MPQRVRKKEESSRYTGLPPCSTSPLREHPRRAHHLRGEPTPRGAMHGARACRYPDRGELPVRRDGGGERRRVRRTLGNKTWTSLLLGTSTFPNGQVPRRQLPSLTPSSWRARPAGGRHQHGVLLSQCGWPTPYRTNSTGSQQRGLVARGARRPAGKRTPRQATVAEGCPSSKGRSPAKAHPWEDIGDCLQSTDCATTPSWLIHVLST